MGRRIVVAGASGLIGEGLCAALAGQGDSVVRLVRLRSGGGDTGNAVAWDPAEGRLSPSAMDGADAVVVLNGVPIGDKRWTEDRKRLISTSRTDAVGTVARTITEMDVPPPVLVTASAMGIYGDRGDEILDESSATGEGFFADVCRAWEEATQPASVAGIRVAHARTGIVLSGRGGALKPMVTPFRLGIGGRIGDGMQWWSWISDDDCIAAFLHIIDTEISGPVNVVGPNPVTNAEFTKALGAAVRRPTIIPIPKVALRVRLGGELAEAVGYVSHRVEPKVLVESGFEFRHETVDEALSVALG